MNEKVMNMKLLYSPSWSGFSIGENEEKRLQAEYHLRKKGYTEAQARKILNGNCPRDLPDLIEVFEMFGGDGVTCEELEEQPYCITSDDEGVEDIITKDNFVQPGVKMDPKGKPEDWELFDIAQSGEAVRLASVLNGFIGDADNGSPFVVDYERNDWDFETPRERKTFKVKRFFFTQIDILGAGEENKTETGLACSVVSGGNETILGGREVVDARFEVDYAKKVLTVRSIAKGNRFVVTIFRGTEDEYEEFESNRRWCQDDDEGVDIACAGESAEETTQTPSEQ